MSSLRPDELVPSSAAQDTAQPDGQKSSTEMLATDLAATRLAAIVQFSDDAIIGKDLDGIVTSWNPGAERIFGFSAEEMIGTSIKRIIPADRQEEEDEILSRIRRGQRVEHFETRRQRKDGRLLDVSLTSSPIKRSDGRIVGASKIARDVTSAKEREREIARLSRLYEGLCHVNQAIVSSHGREELFQKICRALVEHAGLRMSWVGWHSPGEGALVPVAAYGGEQGSLAAVYVHPAGPAERRDPTGTAFLEERPYVCNDLLNDPGTRAWVDQTERMGFRATAAFPIREASVVGGTLTVHADEAGYFRDKEIALIADAAREISFALDNLARDRARRQAEQGLTERTIELQHALVRAEAADRVKSAFLATMSHELRTPLNSIIGFTGIILQGLAGPLTAEQAKQLGMVQRSGRHLLELINDVLDLSKIEADQLEIRFQAFDLRRSLESVVASVMPLAQKKGLLLTANVPQELPEMVSDRRRVEQIVLNLVSNALKFTVSGSITLTVVPGEREASRPPDAGWETVAIRITDTGIGVKAEDLPKLFQPFAQLDTGVARQHEGTGLGLAICRRLATLLGGSVAVESEWRRGSQFTVTLPRKGPRP